MGARPLKRFIQSQLETKVASYLLRENPKPETTVEVSAETGSLTVQGK